MPPPGPEPTADAAEATADGAGGRDSLQALARGLAALSAFGPGQSALTLSDVARLTGMTRASARRILLTFQSLGYLRVDDRHFSPTLRVLDLGWAFLDSLHVEDLVKPLMTELVAEVEQSVALCALDGPDIVYLARVHTPHLLIVAGGLGSRLPAAATASGRILLAELGEQALEETLRFAQLTAYTHRSVIDPDSFRSLLGAARRRGWAMVDEELEMGLRGIAVAVRDRTGDAVAALGISSSTSRVTVDDLQDRCLPALQRTAARVSAGLGFEGGVAP